MSTCSRCKRYYSPHALWCVHCYDTFGHLRTITSAIELPSVGDTYTDPAAGDTQEIVSVELRGTTIVLGLSDKSFVDIEASALISLPLTLARPGAV